MIDLNLDDDDYNFLTNIFYEDLVACAKARLFSEEKSISSRNYSKYMSHQDFPVVGKEAIIRTTVIL